MSRIDELIAAHCPDGVEFRALGEIFDMKAGKFISANEISEVQDENFPYPCYGGNGIRGFVRGNNQDGKYVLIGRQGALCGNVKRSDGKFFATEHAVVCDGKIEVDMDWAYYLLATMNLNQYATKSAQPGLAVGTIEQVRAPLPPIEIQREIVKVLDTFTELEAKLGAELGAELAARRRQYKYYRDALFAFGEQDVRWTTMADVGEFFRGRRFTKNDLDAEGVACIHYGDIYTQYGTAATETVSRVRSEMAPTLRFAKSGDLVIAGVGETVEDVGKAVAWLGDGEVAIHDDCFAFRHSLNPKFVSYYFQTTAFHAEKNKFVARAKVKRLSGESLGKLALPVPSPEEQERIVAILDRFDALVNDISIGLPAEIKARRQQYEHYRDRLLTFRKAA